MTHEDMTGQEKALLFEGQRLHLVCLFILLAALALASFLPGFAAGKFLGLSTTAWMVLAVSNAILHQVYVWLCWRLELGGKRLTALWGTAAFQRFAIGFAALIILRPILAFILAWSNRGTLPISPTAGIVIALILAVPTLYLVYSVRKYFGFARAFGIDHFDASYRDMALERRAIFTWSPNAMYVFGFLALWIPAFLFQSHAALALAAFSHAYIWVHYFCTEQPDMKRIYG